MFQLGCGDFFSEDTVYTSEWYTISAAASTWGQIRYLCLSTTKLLLYCVLFTVPPPTTSQKAILVALLSPPSNLGC